MIIMVCTIYDKRGENYGPPMCFPTLGIAERHFGDSVNDPNNIMNKHAADFVLYSIGTFDTETAEYEATPARVIGEATQLKQQLSS